MYDRETLQKAYVEGQDCWPGILISREAFEARVSQSLARIAEREPAASFPSRKTPRPHIVTADLYLAVALAVGDRAAWERFYQDHFDFVRNLAGKYAASPDDAEELAQKFCSEIQQRIRNYAGLCSLRGWLCAVVPNVVRDHYRARSKETSLETAEEKAQEGGRPVVLSDEGRGAEDTRARLDRSKCSDMLRLLLIEAVECLKPQWRDLVFYRYAGGLKGREIARAIFRVNEDVVSKWLKKALAKLEKRILHLATVRYRSNRSEIQYCLDIMRGEGFGGL